MKFGSIQLKRNTTLTILFFNLFALTLFAHAFKGIHTGLDGSKSITTKDKPLASVPFKFDGRVLMPVSLNDSKPLDLILDTGNPGTTLLLTHRETGEALNLNYIRSTKLGSGAGSEAAKSANIAAGVKLSIANSINKDVNVAVIDESRDESIHRNDGVVGGLIFRSYVVKIDFDEGMIHLYDPNNFKIDQCWTEIPLIIERNVPLIETTIRPENGPSIPVKLFVDLGAEPVLDLSIDSTRKIVEPENIIYTLGGVGLLGDVYVNHGRISDLRIGEYALENVISGFAGREAIPNFGPIPCDGLLGIGTLYRFNMVFDYAHQKMYIKPNSHFSDPFEFNMSGSVIRENGLGENYIHYVIENSEAEKKGLKKGDVVKEINGREIGQLGHFEMIEMFQTEGKTVNLTILRNRRTMKFEVSLKRLI